VSRGRRQVPPVADIEVYEIDTRADRFGRMRSSWPERARACRPRAYCYGVRYGAQAPCERCPAREVSPQRRSDTRIFPVEGGARAYDVVTAQYVDGATVRLTVRRIDEDVLSGLIQARVARLAEEAKLTAREREVLAYLLMGRSPAEIARVVGISPRTVKFHQTNLLHKLGADDRADLPRLIL
jgi:DNA-binding CsgD family transcriptional regulator